MQKWLSLYNEYSVGMTLVTGLKSQDLLVFFYLFGKKVFDRQPLHSAHSIYTGINAALTSSVSLVVPTEGITEGDCSKALDKLVEYRFVERQKPKGKSKVVSEEGGRPPSYVYEAGGVVQIREHIIGEIELKKNNFLLMLDGLRQLEEEVGQGR